MWLTNPAVIVPLAAFAVAIVAIVSGTFSKAHNQRLDAEQRLALIARGVPLEDIEKFLTSDRPIDASPSSSPTGRMRRSRSSALGAIGAGLGLTLFGFALAAIVQERDVLVVAAAGLIPLVIGLALLADYNMQRSELDRIKSAAEDVKL